MTAVEWLVQQICGEHTKAWKGEIQQAIEMEKQQIINAFDEGNPNGFIIKDGEEYYNETYKPSTQR